MPEHDLLLALLDQAFDRRSWHGTNLRGSLRRVDAEAAAWRPQPGRHNVWEIAVHCAYWKYAVWRRLSGAARASFSLRGSNWFERPVEPSEAAWRQDLRLLDQWHRTLREAVADFPTSKLGTTPRGSRFTLRDLVTGAAAHDLYHAGQIQLLKRLRATEYGGGEKARQLLKALAQAEKEIQTGKGDELASVLAKAKALLGSDPT